MPAAGGLVPGEHPLGVMVAAVGPVMLETLPMPLVRVVGEGDPPGAVVGKGAQFVVPIAGELGGAAASNSADKVSAVAPNRAGKSIFITHILSLAREGPLMVQNAHAIGELRRVGLCRRRENRERAERPSSVPG